MTTPDELRDLARRARRLATSLTAEADRQRLLKYAAELERQAVELEKGTDPAVSVPRPDAAPVLQQQVQVQQQHETGPAADPETEKRKD